MEEFITSLAAKVGISEEQAKQVVAFLQENAGKVTEMLANTDLDESLKEKLPGGLGKLF